MRTGHFFSSLLAAPVQRRAEAHDSVEALSDVAEALFG